MIVPLASLVILSTLCVAQSVPFKTLAAAKGKYFGCAATLSETQNSSIAALMKSECSLTTPGNEMKWDATEPSQNTFTFADGDAVVAFAQANNMSVRGHNLVWHSQLPTWVSSGTWTNATLQAAMVNHITNVVSHYKGKVIHWDVVNEPFNDDGTYRQTIFYDTIGPQYIAIALQAARAADPNVKLFLNDYNLDYTGAKANAMVSLVKSLIAQGVPIDGIGSESHLIVGSVNSYAAALTTLASAGVSVAITELDIRTTTPETTAASAQQQTDYQTVVAACVATSACIGVETWGITDASSWIPSVFSGYGAALPYDANYQPKSAVTGIVLGFGGSTASATTTTAAKATSTTTTTVKTSTTTTAAAKTTTSTTATSAKTSATTAASGSCSALYGQCGGSNWTGPTCCVSSTCKYSNAWYSQCL
ncbi:hypothetical protein HDU83_008193 [Entophlyctis luteolus]|nr:hypothetical protein HDU82_000848 [Entophlyctis luteolus]KAJ3352262.1 hypothetical protein HDU83_008193 [Entophlyctis luteolus]